MLSVVCPSCSAQLQLDVELKGKRVRCGTCSNTFLVAEQAERVAIPIENAPVQSITPPPTSSPTFSPNPSVSIRTHAGSQRRNNHKPSVITQVLSLLIQLGVSASIVYMGYYFLVRRQPVQKPQKVAPIHQRQPERSPALPTPKKEVAEVPPPIKIKPVPIPQTRVAPNPFKNSPDEIELPEVNDGQIVTLLDGAGADTIELIAQDGALTHEDMKLLWKDKEDQAPSVVAGLALLDGNVSFRWLKNVPSDSENAIRNSFVRLSSAGKEHIVALRQTVVTESVEISLRKSVQRIKAKVEHPPSPDSIYCEFSGASHLPPHRHEGCDLNAMKLNDVAKLWYPGANAAVTQITFMRIGNLVALELDTRYTLPSGDEEPMSIQKGNRKRKTLMKQLNRAKLAPTAIPELNSYLRNLEQQLAAARRSRTNTIVNVMKISDLQDEITSIKNRLQNAEHAKTQIPVIERDLAELTRVATLAQALHKTKGISFRFYRVVEGREFDLLIGK